MDQWNDEKLRMVWKLRQRKWEDRTVKSTVERFVKQNIMPRKRKMSKISEAWINLLPEELVKHSCFESFNRGTLTVKVDSASHLAELNMMLREGLVDAIREHCSGVSITRIKLIRGSWYRMDEEGHAIPEF